MPYFNPRLSPLYAAITMLGLAMPLTHAVTLGDLQIQSYVGQPFRASVPYRLNAGESLNEQCIELQHGISELPSMGAATIQLRPSSEQSGTFLIESRSAVGEPMIAFAIKIACGNQQISRDFTAFLNIAPIHNEREPLTRFAVREAEQKSRDVATTPLKKVEEFVIKKPMSLKELTKRYYPANTPQYPRYLKKLSNTNPDLDPNEELSVGTTVIIPERLRSIKKKSAPTMVVESGQLRLDAAEPSASSKPTTPQTAAQYTKDLEQKVKMLEELQLQMQIEVEQLNQKLSQLNAVTSVASTVAIAATTPTQVASAIQTKSASPSQVVITPAESKTTSGFNGWLIGAGLALLAACAALITWRRRQSQDDNWSPDQEPTAHTLMGQLNALTKRGKPSEHATMMSMLHAPGQGIEVSDYGNNDLAQIQIMLAQGDIAEAIDLLYKSIDEDPEDIERWLMLFRVFRQQGMKTEYAALAKNLRLIVKDEADWELVRNIGAKLDPENHLYRRTENPLSEVADSTRPPAPHVDLDIHPEPSPAAMMRAFLEPKPVPKSAPVTATIIAAPPIDEILLDLQLPETTGDQIQGSDTINSDFDTVPVFEVDLLPPFEADDANLNWDTSTIELAPQEPKPPKPSV